MARATRAVVLAVVVVMAAAAGGTAAATTGTAQESASVTISAQTSGGQTVTVDEVTLPNGGFVTIHDASLGDGEVLGSVVGTSTYLEPGTHEDVEVKLSQPLSEDASLIAMPHKDTDGDRTYEFVTENGEVDGPYTADGEIVTDTADVTVSATVSMSDQPSDGTTIVVDRVELSEPGFIAVHDETLLTEGDAVGSVVGHSERLPAGVHENVRIELDESVDSQTIIPMPHKDTNDNEAYDFPDADGPFANANGDAVVDTAEVTVEDTASVSFAAQSSGGTTVTVEEVYLSEGGFVVMHDEKLQDGEAVESVVGASAYLGPGLHRNVEVTLEEPLEGDETLTAMPHKDTNGDEEYEFPDADGPYTSNGNAVVDDGAVIITASVSMADQTSDGHTVVVEDVDLAEGGFVVIHDSSLFAGEVEDSVLGSSEYLEAGHHEQVEITLDEPADESQLLVPMAHKDTNGNEAYDFPDADGPYTYDGGAVVDTAYVHVNAVVSASAQDSEGETIVVDRVTLANGGFVTIHDSSLLDGDVFDSVRGTSEYLPPGTHENVEITLDEPLEGDDTVFAMAHQDTDNDQAYTFVESEGAADGPYVAGGSAVMSGAEITYTGPTPTPTDTATEMGTETEMMETTESMDETDAGAPGFGAVVAVIAVLGSALLAHRRD